MQADCGGAEGLPKRSYIGISRMNRGENGALSLFPRIKIARLMEMLIQTDAGDGVFHDGEE